MSEWKRFTPYLQGGSNFGRALAFYRDVMGFSVVYTSDEFVILERDEVELFLQNYEDLHVASMTQVRVEVRGIAAMHESMKAQGVLGYRDDVTQPGMTDLEATPWGTREFTVRDWAGNALQFYEPLETQV